MRKGATILIIVVAIAAIAIVAVAATSSGSEKQADGRFNYEVEVCDQFEGKDGKAVTPSAGMEFAIVKVRLVNDRADAITTNGIVWQWHLQVGDVQYSASMYEYSHPLYKLVDVKKGGECLFAHVFEVPKGTAVSDIHVSEKFTIGAKVVLDKGIKV